VVVVVTVMAVFTVVVATFVRTANLEFIEELASRRGLRGGVSGRRLSNGFVVVVVMTTMTDVAMFATFTDGLSNDRCDGSSSENECNGKFDLNHF